MAWRKSACLSFLVVVAACDDDPAGTGGGSSSSTTTSAGSSSTGAGPQNVAPTAVITATPESGQAPLPVTLDGSQSTDPDGQIVSWAWTIDGAAASGSQVMRTLDAGCHTIELTVTDDDGATGTASLVVAVADGEPVLPPDVTVEEAPLPSAVLPRDVVQDEGSARFTGVVTSSGFTHVRAEVMRADVVEATVSVPLCDGSFVIDAPIPSELASFDVKLSLVAANDAHEFYSVLDLVAGDIYVIQGQSNAASAQYAGDANENQSSFVRSFGTNSTDGTTTAADVTWRMANGNAGGGQAAIGQWPMRMAGRLAVLHETPIGIVNGALGGQPIDYFQRDDADPTSLETNYGRLLTRMQAAGLADSVRAILWYQGESDGADFQAHHDGFLALKADWAEDYPGIERLYVTQLRAGCGGDLIRTQEVQRKLQDDFSEITVMSTTGLNGHDGCHYAYASGYRELGDRYVGLLGRDLYGETPALDVQPPNPDTATFAGGGTQIVVQMRNPASILTAEAGVGGTFRLEGTTATIGEATIENNQLVLSVVGDASAATGLTYLGAVQTAPWVLNESAIGLLAFHALPIGAE